LDRQLVHKKEELHLLQESMVQAKADLEEALRLGETEVAEKCSHIRVCFSVGFLKSPRTML
jgi:centriolin